VFIESGGSTKDFNHFGGTFGLPDCHRHRELTSRKAIRQQRGKVPVDLAFFAL
jgi:hypothetical protein